MKFNTVVLLVTALSASVFAQATQAGNYSGLAQPTWYNGGFYLNVASMSVTNSPSCRTRQNVTLQESDYNGTVFKSKYAMLLAAWFAQRPVYLVGTGQCTSEGDEVILAIYP